MIGTSLVAAIPSLAQDTAQVTTALAKLRPSVPPDEQLEALRSIATSLDPRIPEACLPMLQSPGSSVQRNAARAIGSRWWQIAPDQQPVYLKALKTKLGSDDAQSVNMARRGIGLLTHSYEGDMFSRSRNKRWLIYERHGKPCVIDTLNHTEELLGFEIEGHFMPAYGNVALPPSCHWHAKQDMVAMDVLIFRRPRLLWVWRPGQGLRSFGIDELRKLLHPAQTPAAELVIYQAEFKQWSKTNLDFTVDYILREGENARSRLAQLRWDSATDTLRVLSDSEQK